MARKRRVTPNDRLREQRLLRKMTQADLAEAVGVTEMTIGRWERGEAFPTLYALRKLCSVFEMTPAELGLEARPPDPASSIAESSPETTLADNPAAPVLDAPEEPMPNESQPPRQPGDPAPTATVRRFARRPLLLAGAAGVATLAAGAAFGLVDFSKQTTRAAHPTSSVARVKQPSAFPIYHGHTRRARTACWSPDDRLIASAGADDIVRVWNASSGDDVATLICPEKQASPRSFQEIYAAAWSPDGNFFACASIDVLLFPGRLSSSTKPVAQLLKGKTDQIQALTWSPDSRFLAFGGSNQTIQIWSVRGNSFVQSIQHACDVQGLAWSPDGSAIAAAAGDGKVCIYDAISGQLLSLYSRHTNVVHAVAWSPDGHMLASASADQTVHLWTVPKPTSGNQTTTVRVYTANRAEVNDVAWSPDGRYLASGGGDQRVLIWQAATGETLASCPEPGAEVESVSWSHVGNRVVSASKNWLVYVWSLDGL